jgi:hypothetical protein
MFSWEPNEQGKDDFVKTCGLKTWFELLGEVRMEILGEIYGIKRLKQS